MSYGGNPKYSHVKIKVLKADRSTNWYADLVGTIQKVEKIDWQDGHITYKRLPDRNGDFFVNDVEEV